MEKLMIEEVRLTNVGREVGLDIVMNETTSFVVKENLIEHLSQQKMVFMEILNNHI